MPSCMIRVTLSGLIESTRLNLTCDSNERFEYLSLEIFLSEQKRDRVSLWQLLCYKMPNFYNMKKMTIFEIPHSDITFIHNILSMSVKTLEPCNYLQAHSSSRLYVLMKGKTLYSCKSLLISEPSSPFYPSKAACLVASGYIHVLLY